MDPTRAKESERSERSERPETSDTLTSGIAGALTGIGVLTLALFPLAIPMLVLTAAFVAPLALVGLVVAIPVAIIAGAVVAIRGVTRQLRVRRCGRTASAPLTRQPRPSARPGGGAAAR